MSTGGPSIIIHPSPVPDSTICVSQYATISTDGTYIRFGPAPTLSIYVVIEKPNTEGQYQWSLTLYSNPPEKWKNYTIFRIGSTDEWIGAFHSCDPRAFNTIVEGFKVGQIDIGWLNTIDQACNAVGRTGRGRQNLSVGYVYRVLHKLQLFGLITASTSEEVKTRFIQYRSDFDIEQLPAEVLEGNPVQMPGSYP
ncbi:unnamed protein product [Fusarium graminearum]|uniref:Uncharacterized protein n=1 Tax=Gibberella zeae TaxID=5518 RepID=A0A4U9F3F1_GIBZA|nr:unnamed protein product [Fusarium graminearum]CAF3571801.1 unnamed protein product [Fusarium graminearum]CAF3634233.1 unnamed protein product [Fusarium graminearum]CAG1973314.1 unnamed protein product [Fusarium graminearum]CAG1974057.1 unnamed protein product [Fusarium graminearum]